MMELSCTLGCMPGGTSLVSQALWNCLRPHEAWVSPNREFTTPVHTLAVDNCLPHSASLFLPLGWLGELGGCSQAPSPELMLLRGEGLGEFHSFLPSSGLSFAAFPFLFCIPAVLTLPCEQGRRLGTGVPLRVSHPLPCVSCLTAELSADLPSFRTCTVSSNFIFKAI